ncbi:acyl carrier protein [Streptomyces pactum]|uniref:Acyl carrier protein n=1 Tax=Streptomyces pactum TaxID=68249 RepID=A0ABS0NK02_9ACTN|nr:acyl carrier protein [Streptomyces pactum]MBH5335528.1 acyl carrier protein [Streptomyces pactum]
MAATLEKEELRKVVAEALDVPADKVTDTANFTDELGVDSLMSLEVMVQVEENYGVKLTEEELRSFGTFQDVYDLLQTRLG